MFHKWRVLVAIKIKQEQEVRLSCWFFPLFSTMFPCLRLISFLHMSQFFQKMLIKLSTFFDPCMQNQSWVFQKAKSVNHKPSLFCLSLGSLSLCLNSYKNGQVCSIFPSVLWSWLFLFCLRPFFHLSFCYIFAGYGYPCPPSHWKL